MNIKRNELIDLIENLILAIEDDFLASDEEEGPGINLTIGCNSDGDWSYQTGSVEYIGPAYFHDVAVSVGVYRDSNPEEVADEIIRQLEEEFAWLEKD